MIIDGRAIAQDIYRDVAERVSAFSRTPKLGIITCAPNPETKQYLALKKRKADDVGISLVLLELDEYSKTEDVVASVKRLASDVDGVVVQLPLPAHIDREIVLQSIPVSQDPDGFAYPIDGALLPPVAAAVAEIADRYHVEWKDKHVVVFGYGRLVGKPCGVYAESLGAHVSVVTEKTEDAVSKLQQADIIIAGAGTPHFITADMVKDGVVIFDAGASEDGGVIVGDVSPEVADKAALFTPVPGGIGPITVAVLLRNLLDCVSQ